MNFNDLFNAVARLGMRPQEILTSCDVTRGERPSAGPSFVLVRESDGFTVLSNGGRGDLFERPYTGHRFKSEADAADYLWRLIRSTYVPEQLSAAEVDLEEKEAEADVDRRTAIYEATGEIDP
jgi:hypothetical protein